MTTKVMKRKYEKPSMRVYELQGHRSMILCASGGGGIDPLSPFYPGNDPLNP